APQRIVGREAADRLERECLKAPWLEGVWIVARILRVDLQAVAQGADMLVERRLEPAIAQMAAFEPVRRERAHLLQNAARFDVRRAEQLERSCRATAFGKRCAF